MRRIAIIGRSGGGKSSLSRRLGEKLGLPVVHLDVLFWRPGWQESETEPFRERLAAALSGDAWISDGNFMDAADIHIGRADTLVWVDQPRMVCVRRALLRAIRERGHNRPDMAEGCDERIDVAFLAYIWNWDRFSRPRVEAAIARHAPATPLVRLTSDRDIATFLAGL